MDDLLHVFFRGLFGKKRDVMSLTRIHEQRNTFNPDFFFFTFKRGRSNLTIRYCDVNGGLMLDVVNHPDFLSCQLPL